ncbi:MAG TPA: septal ring lytic transglycosylase RlpA family protein [Steroidobacteraceae bacterium]|nr:septal ring lytic transglycosylase RlpA family protein [Steroidobacteraceae bacterium]
MTDLPRIRAAAALALLLAACASAPRRTAPLPPPPAADVPDAVPRVEPRSNHGNPPFYDVNGQRYTILASADNFVERGVASWYGPDFHGHNTSSGEVYDMYAMTAAHRTLPIPCYARVTNLSNGRSVVVRINDRGPFVANRIIDLSYSAASRLDIVRTGTAFVEVRTIGPADAAAAEAPAPLVGAAPPAPVAATAPPAPTGSPVADAAAATLDAAPPAAVALYIQVGAFADPANAQRVLDRLQSNGVAHVFSVASDSSGRTLRRVRIGPIATVEEFDALAARLAALGYPEARLAND